MKIYAVYKGEEFLYEGTAKECAKHFGVKPDTIRWWNTVQNKKRGEGKTKSGKERKRKIAIVVEGD